MIVEKEILHRDLGYPQSRHHGHDHNHDDHDLLHHHDRHDHTVTSSVPCRSAGPSSRNKWSSSPTALSCPQLNWPNREYWPSPSGNDLCPHSSGTGDRTWTLETGSVPAFCPFCLASSSFWGLFLVNRCCRRNLACFWWCCPWMLVYLLRHQLWRLLLVPPASALLRRFVSLDSGVYNTQ